MLHSAKGHGGLSLPYLRRRSDLAANLPPALQDV